MKKQKTKQASAGQKREAEEPLSLPTLGLVAEEERFAPLRELLQPVAGRPVNELSEELRRVLRKKAGDDLELLLVSFFAACDVRAREIERKRATAESQGPQQRSFHFSCVGVVRQHEALPGLTSFCSAPASGPRAVGLPT